MSRRRFTQIRLAAQTAQIRTARLYDREHLVMPVVLLVGDAVVRPMHSDGPEYVPAEVLRTAPSAWDNRPVVPDHPDNGHGSANTPRTLERWAYGAVFNARYDAGRLKGEIWLDPQRAEAVGGDAERVLATAQRALDGEEVEPVEVSIGAWVTLVQEAGTSPSGEPYEYRWDALVPDHLAAGLNGAEGACSVEMGCGTPRAARAPNDNDNARRAVMRAAEDEEGTDVNKKSKTATKAAAEGLSDHEKRELLQGALEEEESGYDHLWVEALFDKQVVYSLHRDGEPSRLFERDYTIDGQATSLAAERRAVRRKIDYEPDPTAAKAGAKRESLLSKLAKVMGLQTEDTEGASEDDIREQLWRLLRATEPGFKEVFETFSSTSTVIYITWPEEEALWWMRHYEVNDEGEVTLADDAERVERVNEYRPVKGASAEPADEPDQASIDFETAAADAGCGCTNSTKQASEPGSRQAAPPHKEKESDMGESKKQGALEELVGRLIANAASPFTDAHRDVLTAMGQERLTSLAETYDEANDDTGDPEAVTEPAGANPAEPASAQPAAEPSEVEPESKPAPAELDPDAVVLKRADYELVLAAAKAHEAQVAAQRSGLIGRLKAAQATYTEAQLKQFGLERLEEIESLLGLDTAPAPASYAGRGVPRPTTSDEAVPAPKPYERALAARKQKEAN